MAPGRADSRDRHWQKHGPICLEWIGELRGNEYHALLARRWRQIESLLKTSMLVNVYIDRLGRQRLKADHPDASCRVRKPAVSLDPSVHLSPGDDENVAGDCGANGNRPLAHGGQWRTLSREEPPVNHNIHLVSSDAYLTPIPHCMNGEFTVPPERVYLVIGAAPFSSFLFKADRPLQLTTAPTASGAKYITSASAELYIPPCPLQV